MTKNFFSKRCLELSFRFVHVSHVDFVEYLDFGRWVRPDPLLSTLNNLQNSKIGSRRGLQTKF